MITIDEAAAMLGVSKMTLYRRIQKRELDPVKNPALKRQPGGVKFRRSDIERLMTGEAQA